MCGIYKITNLINNKIYIGQSRNIAQRWKSHRNPYRHKEYSSYPLYRAINKYGLDNFSFEIIEECLDSDLNEREKYWIQHYHSNSSDFGYNQTSGGDGNNAGNKLNLELVEEITNLLLEHNYTETQIAEMYNVTIYTIRDINVGRSWIRSDISYPICKSKQWVCKICGSPVYRGNDRCVKCYRQEQINPNKPSKEELQQILFQNNGNFSAVGRIFNLTDNAIRKWCKSYNLPYHSSDYKINK